MKLKETLMILFGIQVLLNLYYLPQNVENLSQMLQNGIFGNLNYLLSTIMRYALLVIGVIGALQFWENKNIFNPYLKAFFIYDVFSFISYIPSNIYSLFSEYGPSYGWTFYFFQVFGLLMAVLAIIVFSKEKVRVDNTPGKKKSTRFLHLFIDNILLLTFNFSMVGSLLFSEMPILGFFLPYLFMILYYWISETVFQQTLGKVVTGKYVRKVDGGRAGVGKILGRTLSRMIPFEPFSFFSYPIKGWHDSISGTNVFTPAEYQEPEDELMDHLIGEDDGIGEKF